MMFYSGIRELNQTKPGTQPGVFEMMQQQLACYGDDNSGTYVIPMLGVEYTDDDGSGTTPPYDAEVGSRDTAR